MMSVIKVVVASSYVVERDILKKLMDTDDSIKVVGLANDETELLSNLTSQKVDIILMDLDNFQQDPVDIITKIMAERPVPIVLLSAKDRKTEQVFEAISAGALTVENKPSLVDLELRPEVGKRLINQIKTLSRVAVIKHVKGSKNARKERASLVVDTGKPKVVAIASSTGGPRALRAVLSALPRDFPLGIVVAQHITQGFAKGLVEWLGSNCHITVKEPVDGEMIKPGVAYIAPDRFHMVVDVGERIRLLRLHEEDHFLPSGNMLLTSVAEVFGRKSIGIVLSGMGDDGVKGLLAISEKGGKTIVQDRESCVVFGMPKVALEKGAARRETPLGRISWEIMREL